MTLLVLARSDLLLGCVVLGWLRHQATQESKPLPPVSSLDRMNYFGEYLLLFGRWWELALMRAHFVLLFLAKHCFLVP